MKNPILYALGVAVIVAILAPLTVNAAKPSRGSGFTITPDKPVGIDISFTDCTISSLPQNASFAVVGVNGGKATNFNPCHAEQLTFAHSLTGNNTVTQVPKVQLYTNTGNPAYHVDHPSRKYPVVWPQSGETPYGSCDGTTSRACVWQYGYEKSVATVEHFVTQAASVNVSSDPTQYRWWLDIETANSWLETRKDADAYGKNIAAIEGYAAGIKSYGEQTYVGIYTNPNSWNVLTGNGSAVPATSPLRQLDTWRTATSFYSYESAKSTCTLGGYNGLNGNVVMTQFVSGIDYDYSCATDMTLAS